MLGDKGLPYILGYRMKSAPAALKVRILGREGARPWSGHGPDDKSEEGWYKVIEHEPKFSSWSKSELWQVVDVEPMPVFGKFYNG